MLKVKTHPMLTEKTQFNIIFIYEGQKEDLKDKEITLSCGQNPLSNNWVYWFSYDDSMYISDKPTIHRMIKNIRKAYTIISDGFTWVK